MKTVAMLYNTTKTTIGFILKKSQDHFNISIMKVQSQNNNQFNYRLNVAT